jgi:very-short-patch-repair endonuclease
MGKQTMGWPTDPRGWSLLRPRAQQMRRMPTEAEALLWERLRRGCLGARFRRQVVIGPFIVDFYCPKARLIVEVDGSVHDERHEIDVVRDREVRAAGLRVLRVRNEDVLGNLDAVVSSIAALVVGS